MGLKKTAWAGVFLLGGLAVSACGGSPKEAGGETPAPASTSAADAKKQNACEFVDRAAIEAMAGKSLTMLHEIQDTDQTACELSDPDNQIVVFSVTVHWKGGKELARIEQAAMSMARQMLNDEDTDILEVTGSEKVRGLADKAFYSDVMPSWALKGDVMIQIIAPVFNHEKTKKAFLLTAKKALSQL